MIIKNAEFKISAVNPKQYPADGLPEIVLVGKSNVGKSSFINTMLNRKKLARTSKSWRIYWKLFKTSQRNLFNYIFSWY